MTRSLFLILSAFALLFDCGPLFSQQQDIVARIADKYTITFPELKKYVVDYQYVYRYGNNIPEAADAALSDMILKRLKVIDFFERGLNKRRNLLRGMMRVLNEELAIEYFNTQFYSRYVDENAVRRAYKQMGKEVVYRQIVLLKPGSASRSGVDSLDSLAGKIKSRIEAGEDFSRLARQYSRDEESSSRGGLKPALTWGMSLLNPVYDDIFHIPAGHTTIVENKEAVRIVRVDRIDTVKTPPYAEAREEIERALRGKYIYVAGDEFDRAKKKLVDEKTLRWNEKGIKQLLLWSDVPGFYKGPYADTIGNALSHGDDFMILKYSGGEVDLKEYLRLLNEVLTLGNAVGIKEDDFKQFVLEAVRTDKVVAKARKLGLEKIVLNPATKNADLVNGIVRIYDDRVIETQIPPATEKALEAFYRANRDSLYYQLAKVNIYAVVDTDKNTVEKMKERLGQGVAFNKLARVILVRTYVRNRDGTIASYYSTEPPYLGEAAFKLKLYQVAGPVEYADSAGPKQYALIKCMATREAKQLTFEDARKTIVDDFKEYYGNVIARYVAEQLGKKYHVQIYENVLKQNLAASGVHVQ